MLAGLVLLCAALWAAFPLPRFALEEDYSTLSLDREGRLLRISLSPSGRYRIRRPLEEISPCVREGILLYEDRWFRRHPGVNPVALVRALSDNVAAGRVVSGGSTITMQIARMMEPKERTISSKLVEIARALQLEVAYSKDELLEIYLNMIPMGGNIEGVGAAAWFYFGKSAKELGQGEALLLIGLPRSPSRNRPDRYPERALEQRRKVLERIGKEMGIAEEVCADILASPCPVRRMENPYRAPHLLESGHRGPSEFFRSYTIDLEVQDFCERALSDHGRRARAKGIHNGAAIVVRNEDAAVLAYVGSPDYGDEAHAGKINGATIRRCPGSVLKPFLYARGIERGIVTPGRMLFDIPVQIDDYGPLNFDRTYRGPVSAREALVQSLNTPAVRLERELKGRGLADFLRGIFPIDRDTAVDDAGLTVVLGGVPVSLEEVVTLFSTLARLGEYRPLAYFTDEPPVRHAARRILDPRACYVLAQILTDNHRPDLPLSWEFAPDLARVAFKTGTSFGLRDAWCVGYNPEYTVGVWLGNADYGGSYALNGTREAAPLFIEIFNQLTRDHDCWYSRPEGVAERDVCVTTGLPPGPFCPHTRRDLYIPGVSEYQSCEVHRLARVRAKDGVELCRACTKEGTRYEEKVVERWPLEVAAFLRSAGRGFDLAPGHNPDCPVCPVDDTPSIKSPEDRAAYALDAGLPSDSQRIPLKASAAQDAGRLQWFIGSRLVATCLPDDTCFLEPTPGDWTVSVVDARGRSSAVDITVR